MGGQMRITTRGRYALRAALAMARYAKGAAPVSIRQLSERERISAVFLEQIFYKLRQAGIVFSVRGPGGGFRFKRPLSELTVKELLDAAGESLELAPCGNDPAGCGHSSDCLAHRIWSEATAKMNEYFSSMTFQSIIDRNECFFDDAAAETAGATDSTFATEK
jgi:Rrf2 family iron-sulfur cluster assembly transcriptional regulator